MGEPEAVRPNPLILVIDDDMTQRVLVREALQMAGFVIDEATNGAEGIAKAAEQRPDLVILDVVMPDLDGFAVCQSFRGSPETKNIPILMVTGLEDEDSIERAFNVGATSFLTKPINWSLLAHEIRYILRSSTAENELRLAKTEAEYSNRCKTEFLANVSHELRTPLNAIIGFSEIMENELLGPLGSVEYRDYASDINDSGKHLLSIINDILDLSKIESGTIELREEDVYVPTVLQSVVRMARLRACNDEMKLEVYPDDDLPLLWADEVKLKQILINLLSNAVKFTEADGQVTLKAWCREDSGFVFQVIDTGMGMTPEDIPKALSQFGQIDSDLNRKFEGTGLGLPLAKSLTELHGGSFDLQSQIGVGTTATVRLPASRIIESAQLASPIVVGDRTAG